MSDDDQVKKEKVRVFALMKEEKNHDVDVITCMLSISDIHAIFSRTTNSFISTVLWIRLRINT